MVAGPITDSPLQCTTTGIYTMLMPAHCTHAICPCDRVFGTLAARASMYAEEARAQGVHLSQLDKIVAYLSALKETQTVEYLQAMMKKAWEDCGITRDGVFDMDKLHCKPSPAPSPPAEDDMPGLAGPADAPPATIADLIKRLPDDGEEEDWPSPEEFMQLSPDERLAMFVRCRASNRRLLQRHFDFISEAQRIERSGIHETLAHLEEKRRVRRGTGDG